MYRFMLYLLALMYGGIGLLGGGAMYLYGATLSGISLTANMYYLYEMLCFTFICVSVLLVIASTNVNTAKWALYFLAFILLFGSLIMFYNLFYSAKVVSTLALIVQPILFILTLIGAFDARKRE